jgi:uncharacterized membrane protein
MQAMLVMYLAFGLLSIALALPLMLEKVKPNHLYGFRIPATLENPRIWYAVNKHFGKRFLVTGILLTVGSFVLYFVPGISVDAYALGCLAIFAIPFGIGAVQSFRYLKTLPGNPD